MSEALFTAPLYLIVRKVKGEWKKDHINLNNYHNWHPRLRNSIKRAYAQEIRSQVNGERFERLELEFKLIRGDKRSVDRANALCLHEKFFCDALVESKVIPDDNDSVIKSTKYISGEIDKGNPRVEIRVLRHL